MAEKLLSDFSGGMNALAAVDKLDPKECLLAENVRLDETGNIQSAGAFTHKNNVAYAAAAGTSTNNVHSLYWNPSLGGVAGVGQDVFTGLTLGGLSSALTAKNVIQQKMSFASAPSRVYFDVSNVGYWSDMYNLLTVDWVPPGVAGAITTGPILVGTGTAVGTDTPPWNLPNNITSTYTGPGIQAAATVPGIITGQSNYLRATMGTNSFAVSTTAVSGIVVSFYAQQDTVNSITLAVTLLNNNIPVGGTKTISPLPTAYDLVTFGDSSDLWGSGPWAQADINSPNFGFQVQAINAGGFQTVEVLQGQITIYQGSGFVAGTGATGTLTGTYTWKVTFEAANGEESDASIDSTAVILSGSQGTLTSIPLGDSRTTARNIYRKGGALTSHYLVGTINDNITTTYSDNETDIAALAAGVILAGDVPGDYPNSRQSQFFPHVRFPVYHYDRIFWVNQDQLNQICWSKPLNGFAYPSVNTIDVGDGKPITRLISIFGELIIFKLDSIWRLTGTDESSFDLTQTPSAVGTDQPFTITDLPDKIIFANRWGLWVFNGYTSQPLTTKLDLWFKQNDRTGKSLFGVNGFHPPEVVTAVPAKFDSCGNSEKYYLAYAETGQASNNALLAFDVKHGNITKREPGTPLPLSVAIDPVTGYVYMGDASGFVSLLDDWNGINGGGSALNFDFQHGYQDFQRGSNKSLWALEFYLNTNGQSLIPYVYYDNGETNETLAAISTSSLQRVVRPLEATAARKCQNFSVRLNGSLTAVNASGTPQIQIVHIKALYDLRVGRARTGQT